MKLAPAVNHSSGWGREDGCDRGLLKFWIYCKKVKRPVKVSSLFYNNKALMKEAITTSDLWPPFLFSVDGKAGDITALCKWVKQATQVEVKDEGQRGNTHMVTGSLCKWIFTWHCLCIRMNRLEWLNHSGFFCRQQIKNHLKWFHICYVHNSVQKSGAGIVFFFYVFERVSSVDQGCIYLIKNTVKPVIFKNIITI